MIDFLHTEKIKDKENRDVIVAFRKRLEELDKEVYLAWGESANGERMSCQKRLMRVHRTLEHITKQELNDEVYSHF